MAPTSAGPERPYLQHDSRDGSIPIGGNSSSTQRWNGVPRGTMDEVSPLGRLDLPTATQGRPLDCSTSSSDPMMEDAMGRRRRGDSIHRPDASRWEPPMQTLSDL